MNPLQQIIERARVYKAGALISDEIIIRNEQIPELTADVLLLAEVVTGLMEAMDKIELRLTGSIHTCFPVNVRELDGSISQHRPKSSEGYAYDEARTALSTARERLGK